VDVECFKNFKGVKLAAIVENVYGVCKNMSNFCGIILLDHAVKCNVITEEEKKTCVSGRNTSRSENDFHTSNFKTLMDIYTIKWKIARAFCKGFMVASLHNDVVMMLHQLYTDVSRKIRLKLPSKDEKTLASAIIYAHRNYNDNYADIYVGIARKIAVENNKDLSTKEETAINIFKSQKESSIGCYTEEFAKTILWIWKQINDTWLPVLSEIKERIRKVYDDYNEDGIAPRNYNYTPPFIQEKLNTQTFEPIVQQKQPEVKAVKSCPFPPSPPGLTKTSIGSGVVQPKLVILFFNPMTLGYTQVFFSKYFWKVVANYRQCCSFRSPKENFDN
jgi:hypothetical protein